MYFTLFVMSETYDTEFVHDMPAKGPGSRVSMIVRGSSPAEHYRWAPSQYSLAWASVNGGVKYLHLDLKTAPHEHRKNREFVYLRTIQ